MIVGFNVVGKALGGDLEGDLDIPSEVGKRDTRSGVPIVMTKCPDPTRFFFVLATFSSWYGFEHGLYGSAHISNAK